MAYTKRMSNQEYKRSLYFQNNKPLHVVKITSAMLFEKKHCTGSFATMGYNRNGGVGITLLIFSKCIVLSNIEGFTQCYTLWFKPETVQEISMNRYMYSTFIEPLEDTPEKRLMLAYLQQFTPVLTDNTKVIKHSFKLVNIPTEKLSVLKGNDNFRIAYSYNDNRVYITDKTTTLETLSTFLQQFEGIPKDVYYQFSLQFSNKGIDQNTSYVYFKPI